MNEIVTEAQLEQLRALDTPTVCNALDRIDPGFGLSSVTSRPLRCVYPDLPPMVGYARTATVRAITGPRDPSATAALRAAYYEYVAEAPGPTIVVIEDLDGERAASGCMWGEINTTLHQRLGCVGTVTNGAIRDVPANAPGFQILAGGVVPSRVNTHVTGFGAPVSVTGMAVDHGDLVHADQHGAVVVPVRLVDEVIATAARLTRQEAALLVAIRDPGFSIHTLPAAFKTAAEVR